ncbi:hypothetical protein GPROT2_01454 [Gammaproteobacteria bacterium]|nr:MAG: hypothetical protein HRU81_06670 [Gammaproteobacteria bacterium]CAG0941817.1 hypothetical protein GPROT2_01454 [Gammaproteobacteria bacterium]
MTEKKIPVLTDMVGTPGEAPPASPPLVVTADELAGLQARIATEGYALMERLLHESLREMEANLFADVIGRLRTELPDLIDDVLQEHFGPGTGRR